MSDTQTKKPDNNPQKLYKLLRAEFGEYFKAVSDEKGNLLHFAEWDAKSGYIKVKPRDVEMMATELTGKLDVKANLRSLVKDAMALLEANLVSTELSEWDPSNYLPFKDSLQTYSMDSKGFFERQPDLLLMKTLPISYKEYTGAGFNHFGMALDEWMPNKKDQACLFRLIGQALLGNPEQKFMFLWGAGGTGKSIFMKCLQMALGHLVGKIDIEYLITRKYPYQQHSTGLQAFGRHKIVISGELPTDFDLKWNEGLIKNVSGGDTMMVRGLYQDFQQVDVGCLIIIYGNQRPNLTACDIAMKRRLVVCPFNNQPAKVIDDKEMMIRMKICLKNITQSIIKGITDYHTNGLQLTQTFKEATDTYIEEEDHLGRALRQCWDGKDIKLADLKSKLEGLNLSYSAKHLANLLRGKGIKVGSGAKNYTYAFSHPDFIITEGDDDVEE